MVSTKASILRTFARFFGIGADLLSNRVVNTRRVVFRIVKSTTHIPAPVSDTLPASDAVSQTIDFRWSDPFGDNIKITRVRISQQGFSVLVTGDVAAQRTKLRFFWNAYPPLGFSPAKPGVVVSQPPEPDRYHTPLREVGPQAARLILVATFALIVAAVAITLSPLASGFADSVADRGTDVALYRAEINRIHAGEGYYQAAAKELPQRGFPTTSVLNWRTPLPLWLIGNLPSVELGKVILGLLALAAMLLVFESLAREEQLLPAVLCAILLAGAWMFCILGDTFVMSELWAGVLIALSLGGYGVGRWKIGVGAGLAAVFIRELAGPYCVVALGIALLRRRWREAFVWLVGLTAYAVFFAVHAYNVSLWRTPDAIAHSGSWLQFGGAAFLISLAQVNAYLLILPQWAAAIYLPLALLGLAGWRTELGERVGLVTAGYVLLFALVGYDFNQYWGALIAPLFCFGAARSPVVIRDLLHAARSRSGSYNSAAPI